MRQANAKRPASSLVQSMRVDEDKKKHLFDNKLQRELRAIDSLLQKKQNQHYDTTRSGKVSRGGSSSRQKKQNIHEVMSCIQEFESKLGDLKVQNQKLESDISNIREMKAE